MVGFMVIVREKTLFPMMNILLIFLIYNIKYLVLFARYI
jgi:hypothetical protein